MAQDADNDNGSRSAIDAIRAAAPNWTNYGPGGTALAASPTTDRAQNAPTLSTSDPDHASTDPATEDQLPGGDDGQGDSAMPPAEQPASVLSEASTSAPHFTVTNAASLSDLGIEFPPRPMPRRAATQPVDVRHSPDHGSAVAASPAGERDHARSQPPPTGPLFNTPPAPPTAEQADAFANAAFATTASAGRTLTSQPGFLLGLVSAAIAGATLYIFLA